MVLIDAENDMIKGEARELKLDELEGAVGGIGVEVETLTPAQQRAHYEHRGGPFRWDKE
jgi:hypothetical protein